VLPPFPPTATGVFDGLDPCGMRGSVEMVDADKASGCIAAEPLTPYPPGIPAVVPGERLDQPVIDYRAAAWTVGWRYPMPPTEPSSASVWSPDHEDAFPVSVVLWVSRPSTSWRVPVCRVCRCRAAPLPTARIRVSAD
jgi:hypothetical protein